ncbi:uncharacterized protein LOC106013274 [Aplysia californica]|uniref:Uncharacterized protein LOC106013274 n=1 Tax=Aplysia californica TaxID=6500 RepID=A0ABM1AAH1_APLCA|nr:uncharacterized protein LOC106013274 [Aplysia californica]
MDNPDLDEEADQKNAPADEEVGTKYNALFYPGEFFIFWNVLVPLSVLLNIRHFGLRAHELGLAVALALNPYLLKFVLHNPLVSWGVALFLIIWIERVLRRWSWYRIYSFTFLKSALMVVVFIAIPSLCMRYLWRPVTRSLLSGLQKLAPGQPAEYMVQARDVIALCFSVGVFLHSLYFHSQCNRCIGKSPCPSSAGKTFFKRPKSRM